MGLPNCYRCGKQPCECKDGCTLYHARCEEILTELPDASIDLIATDPPYFRVKNESWDRQWDKPEQFLAWMATLCAEWRRVLKPNGSLYVFASPQMAWHVEGLVRQQFNVLNAIRWKKDAGWAQRQCKEEQRAYFPASETIVFAEQFNGDSLAADASGYYTAAFSLHREVYQPLGDYFKAERERAGMTRNEVEVALGYVSSADPTRGTALCCRWEEGSSLPTVEAYERYRVMLNSRNGHNDYLPRSYEDLRQQYEDLRQQYEDLRQQYEDLRQQYEDLRRPFSVSASVPYTDVWDYPTVQDYPGKHPCEKPLAMMEHIIQASSRPDAMVLDCFGGSGVTAIAARNCGRKCIIVEMEKRWARRIDRRLAQQVLFT